MLNLPYSQTWRIENWRWRKREVVRNTAIKVWHNAESIKLNVRCVYQYLWWCYTLYRTSRPACSRPPTRPVQASAAWQTRRKKGRNAFLVQSLEDYFFMLQLFVFSAKVTTFGCNRWNVAEIFILIESINFKNHDPLNQN